MLIWCRGRKLWRERIKRTLSVSALFQNVFYRGVNTYRLTAHSSGRRSIAHILPNLAAPAPLNSGVRCHVPFVTILVGHKTIRSNHGGGWHPRTRTLCTVHQLANRPTLT